jgi:hypothetical protein
MKGWLLAVAAMPVLWPATARPAPGGEVRNVEIVERVSEDSCERARAFEITDDSPAAQHARRLCRLQQFEQRLAAERRQELAAELQAREARVAAWLDANQPTRVLRPVSIEGFTGTGLTSYGALVNWTVLRRVELGARVGWRKMTCADDFGGNNADCTRRGIGATVRFFLSERDFTPFIGGGLTVTTSHLQAFTGIGDGGVGLVKGNGVSHSASANAGLHLAVRWLRASLEYVYDYVYYTGAINQMTKAPSEDLRVIWRDSLKQDRHGIRLQVGYAF